MELQFSVTPKKCIDPCPRLLQHIKTVLVSNNQGDYEYLLDWLSWIVKHPEEKTGVSVVFVSDQGTGKSILINVLQKIFGIHCLQITNTQHLFPPFSTNMDNKVLIILEEITWGGDEVHQGLTSDDLLYHEFAEIISSNSYWNLMFVSNQRWYYSASEDNVHFFIPNVSSQRIGDNQYFSELYHELNNGGVEEFLYYLLNRQLPSNWTPAPPPNE